MNKITTTILMALMTMMALPLSAAVKTQDYSVDSFSKLYVSGIEDVTINYGQDFRVSVTTDESRMDSIQVTPKNSYMNITAADAAGAKAEITVPFLTELTLSTGTNAVLNGIGFPVDMDVTVRNNSSLAAGMINADDLNLQITDGSSFTAGVSANAVIARVREASMNVTGDTDTLRLDADDATLAMKGFSIDKAVIDLDDECIADIALEDLNTVGSPSSTELAVHGESEVTFTTAGDLAAVVDGDSDLDYAYFGRTLDMNADATSSIRRM